MDVTITKKNYRSDQSANGESIPFSGAEGITLELTNYEDTESVQAIHAPCTPAYGAKRRLQSGALPQTQNDGRYSQSRNHRVTKPREKGAMMEPLRKKSAGGFRSISLRTQEKGTYTSQLTVATVHRS